MFSSLYGARRVLAVSEDLVDRAAGGVGGGGGGIGEEESPVPESTDPDGFVVNDAEIFARAWDRSLWALRASYVRRRMWYHL